MNSKYLYHYTSFNGLQGILNDKAIRATHIRYLNDKKEFIYTCDMIKKLCPAGDNKVHGSIETLIEIANSVKQSQNVIPFVACFSEDGDLLSQWRAYCKYGDGYNLGFDFAHLAGHSGYDIDTKLVIQILKCIYEKEQQKNRVNNFIRKYWQILFEGLSFSNNHPQLSQCIGDFFVLASQLKNPSFWEEKEYRLVVFLPDNYYGFIKYRQGKSNVIPYINLDFAQGQKNIPAKIITVGPTSDFKLAFNMIGTSLKSKNMSCCNLEKTESSYREI